MRGQSSRRAFLRSLAGGTLLSAVGWGSTQTATGQGSADAWRQVGYDGTNTGYNPGATGPLDVPERRWTFEMSTGGLFSPIVANDEVYVPDGGTLFALSASDGGVRWSFDVPVDVGVPAVADDRIYVPAGETVYALDPPGDEQWSFTADGPINAPPSIRDDTLFVVDRSRLYAVDTSSGTENWRYTAGFGSRAVVGAGTAWMSGANLFGLFWDRPGDGLLQGAWEENATPREEVNGTFVVEYETLWHDQPAPTLDGTTLYAPGFLVAIDTDSGEQLWEGALEGAVTASPAAAHGRVYVGTGDTLDDISDELVANAGTVYALDADDGAVEWSFETGGAINRSPAVTDDVVYVPSEDGTLYALDPGDGALLWETDIDPTHSTPAVVGELLYIYTASDGLVAFGDPVRENDTDDSASGGDDTGDGDDTGGDGADSTGDDSQQASSDGQSADDSGPGFGVAGALAGLGGVSYLCARRGDE